MVVMHFDYGLPAKTFTYYLRTYQQVISPGYPEVATLVPPIKPVITLAKEVQPAPPPPPPNQQKNQKNF